MANRYGNTALHVAINDENINIIKSLVDNGFDANIQNRDGDTGLHLLMQQMNEKLYSFSPDSYYIPFIEIAKVLIPKTNVNLQNKDGETVLHIATQGICAPLIKLLLEAGANIHLQDKYGNTALKSLLSRRIKKSSDNPKRIAAYHTITKLLIDAGIDVNRQDKNGLMALHVAVTAGDLAMFKMIGSKSNIDAQTNAGKTPLHFATSQHKFEMARILIDANANIHLQDEEGYTALMHSVSDIDMVRLLLLKGADVNVQDIRGCTALHRAEYEVTQLLIEAGANVNAIREDGHTKLYSAIAQCDYKLAKLLLNAGADINLC